ncbi:MAG: dihydropteroate synthase, partial [Clostridia bacterium]|nr:dihydropteroate synthase [Clostridia bacterium]
MSDIYETKAALLAAKENSALPVFVSNAYGEDGKLMTGASPEAMCALAEAMGADAIGLNCSFGPKQLIPVAKKLLEVASIPVILKPNAGLPKSVDGKTVYDVPPKEFAEAVSEMLSCGIRIAGGCCGTTPEYIEELVHLAKDIKPAEITPKNLSVVSSYTHTVDFKNRPVLIGERINPTGKKRFRQALLENDIDYILKEGVNQQDKGVHILDVNVGLPDIDESKVLKTCVCELQSIIDLPLQIDTSNTDALSSALRRYNGKAMINSVNGKQSSMDAVFPLVKKYGGLVVALTLDENGIPETAQKRLSVAKKILCEAKKYGLSVKDLIFDPLAMAVSADKNAARVTLDTVRLITNELGANTILGISNISFGLPVRDSINSSFFTSALENGLSAAIMNPYSDKMLSAYYSFKVLHGLDENCLEYIENMSAQDTAKEEKSISDEDL